MNFKINPHVNSGFSNKMEWPQFEIPVTTDWILMEVRRDSIVFAPFSRGVTWSFSPQMINILEQGGGEREEDDLEGGDLKMDIEEINSDFVRGWNPEMYLSQALVSMSMFHLSCLAF